MPIEGRAFQQKVRKSMMFPRKSKENDARGPGRRVVGVKVRVLKQRGLEGVG